MLISFLFSFAFCFSSLHSYLQGLLRQPFSLFSFLFLGDGLDHCLLYEVKWSEVTQSCLTLCDPMDGNLPGSAVHGIFQARILEWGAISFSRGSSQPRDRTQVCCIADRRFTVWATREAPVSCIMSWTSIHSSSGNLSIKSSPLNLFLTSTV